MSVFFSLFLCAGYYALYCFALFVLDLIMNSSIQVIERENKTQHSCNMTIVNDFRQRERDTSIRILDITVSLRSIFYDEFGLFRLMGRPRSNFDHLL